MTNEQTNERKKAATSMLTNLSAMILFAVISGSIYTFWTAKTNEKDIDEIKEESKEYVKRHEIDDLKEFLKIQFDDLKKQKND